MASSSLEAQAESFMDRIDSAFNSFINDFDRALPGTREEFSVRLLRPNEVRM